MPQSLRSLSKPRQKGVAPVERGAVVREKYGKDGVRFWRYPVIAASISRVPGGMDMPSKPVNVKQVMVYLTHAQHERLQKLKEKTGAPMSERLRRAIDRYLKVMERRS